MSLTPRYEVLDVELVEQELEIGRIEGRESFYNVVVGHFSSLVFDSRFPVGSSAKTIVGCSQL